MKKIVSSCMVVLLCFVVGVTAQVRTVTGRVTDEKGAPVPSASIVVKGKTTGVAASENGSYAVNAQPGDILVVSSVNFATKEVKVGTATVLNIILSAETALSEVVVTALGVRRKAEEIGYATTRVGPEQITAGKSFNLAQALAGKVGGLVVTNTSASVNATPRIVLRGLRSISGDNTALIVLDGVAVPANTINYINPNDVERIDVMKGGQAATLFGSEGVNGAIMITTKKGNRKPEITVTHSSNIENLAYLPKTQHGFGSGSAYGSSREENFHPAENQQYGPAYDGSLRPLGRQLSDGSILLLPYSDIPDMRKQFWNTGYTAQSDVSYRAGDANSSFYASYQNLHSDGIVPGDKYNRNSLRMNSSKTYGKFNLSFDATYAWDHADRTNSDFYFFALNSASWTPTSFFKDWRNNKFADPSNYFNDYYANPWWNKDNNRFDTKNTYFNGNVKMNFKASNELDFTARVAIANTNTNTTTTANTYTFSGWARTAAFVNYYNNNYDRFLTGLGRSVARTPIAGSIGESQSNGNRFNADLFGNYNKSFGDVSLKVLVGGAVQARTSKNIGVSTNGIGSPDLFNLTNSSTGLYSGSNGQSTQRKIGAYGDVTVGYKGFIYGHGVVRRDYTSVFSGPTIGFNDPTFTTYGADVSFILTDAFPSLKSRVVDNVKIRASYNKNANDNLGAYSLQTIYGNASGFPYSGLLGTTVGGTIVDPSLKPEIVKTTELGLEFGLWNNRLTVEASYYYQQSQQQILNVSISNATGFQNYLLNAADVTNQGIDIEARAVVVKNKDWTVNVNGNYAYTTNVVNTLYGGTGLNSLEYQAPDALASLNAEKGMMFPSLRTTVFQRDADGRVIIDPHDGWPLRASSRVTQGTTLPKHVLGVGLNVSYKNFTLIANAEYRGGHVVYHDIGTDMTFTGTGQGTALYGRDQFVWPNSVYLDGSGKSVPNTNIAVDNYKAIYQGFGDLGFSRGFTGIGEMFVSSGAFWKLRDLSLTYDFPTSLFRNMNAIKGISLTAFARNLITLLPADNWYADPEFSNTNGNATGINNTLNTPPVRQIGGTLRVIF